MTISNSIISVLESPEKCTLKRIAWSYGCSKKGSEEERMLLEVLMWKAREMMPVVQSQRL